MSILATTDFSEGRWFIPLSPTDQTAGLPQYIDRVENEYLPRMFGKSLYDLFIIDYAILGNFPTDPRFVFIFEPFITQETECEFNHSVGMKDMLKGLVYYCFLRDRATRATSVNLSEIVSANANPISAINHDINSRYNDAIATYKAIQYYMDQTNSVDYPEFEGLYEHFNHTF
jgi:hypothetical protein